jgi:GNAT superfamily N-acetyltransferase
VSDRTVDSNGDHDFVRNEASIQIGAVAGDEQLQILKELFREYAATLGIDLAFQGFDREVNGLPGAYVPPRGRLLLARVDGGVAGCVAVRPLSADTCEMKRLYVKPEFRGKGVGALLIDRIIAEARSCGFRRMVLDTLPEMHTATALYAAAGFRRCEAYYQTPIRDTVFMELSL